MASQLYVPGPVQVYVGTGASNAYEFLGWSNGDITVDLQSAWDDVIADHGGPTIPVDSQYMGEQAFIPMTIVRYQHSVLNKIAARLPSLSGTSAGSLIAGEIGSLAIGTPGTSSGAYPLLLYFPYVVVTGQTGQIACYAFSAAWLDATLSVPVSVRVKTPRIVFRAIPLWNAVAGTAVLYSTTAPSPLPTPA